MDVDIPIVAENETAKVHVAMWLERVSDEELRGSGPPHTLKEVALGPDIGFNVRSAHVQGDDDEPINNAIPSKLARPLSPLSADLLAMERGIDLDA